MATNHEVGSSNLSGRASFFGGGVVVGGVVTVGTVGDGVGNGAAVVGNGKVPSASPTDMFSLDSRFRGNDGTVVVCGGGGDGGGAVVAGTVATVGDSISDGAIATVGTVVTDTDGTVTVATIDTVIDVTAADTGSVKKQNFHTGLDPVSRTNEPAKPTEFNAAPPSP